MFTDDIGRYRNDRTRPRYTPEITVYRQPPYGFAGCTDDIAPWRGRSLSALVRIAMFAFFVLIGVLFFWAGAN